MHLQLSSFLNNIKPLHGCCRYLIKDSSQVHVPISHNMVVIHLSMPIITQCSSTISIWGKKVLNIKSTKTKKIRDYLNFVYSLSCTLPSLIWIQVS